MPSGEDMIREHLASRWSRGIVCVGVATAIFALYVLTFTKCYHGDALYHSSMAEGLRPHSPFFRAGHLLLISLLQAWYWLLQQFGFSGRAILAAQYLNSAAAAIGVGFLAATVQLVTRNKWLAAPLAILAGGGFGLWWVSVDAHGYSVPFLCISVVLWLLVRAEQQEQPTRPAWHGLFIALWHSAAVLVHQMALFAGPGILLFLLLGRKPVAWKLRAAVTYLLVSSLLVGGVFLAIAFGCGYARSLPEFIAWNTVAKGEGPYGTPFHPGYVVPKFVRGFAQLFVWYDDNSSVAGRKFLEGEIGFLEAIRQCSLVPLFISWTAMIFAMVWLAVSARRVRERLGAWPFALILWGLTFFVLFAWWLFADPWKWCFVLAPFITLVAVSLDDFLFRTSHRTGVRVGTIALLWVLAVGCVVNNCVVKMWPDSHNSYPAQISQRLHEAMTPKDALFAPYGCASTYWEYFERRRATSIYDMARNCWRRNDPLEKNRARVLAELDRQIRGVQSAGCRVFLEGEGLFEGGNDEWKSPWPLYRSYLEWKGVTKDLEEHLRRYAPRQAFPEFPGFWVLEKGGGENERSP